MQSPNFVGCPIGFVQLVLYCIYRERSDDEAPDEKPRDIEQQQENGLKVATMHPQKIAGREPEAPQK
jgi:solute carrier family 50 (sugar transporter)